MEGVREMVRVGGRVRVRRGERDGGGEVEGMRDREREREKG